ncbi:MAG: YicC family protein, partial [Candidatus Rokubacteria bacterium]|nr:YicC family protein [Candidatus Rokubacteria bacterium]
SVRLPQALVELEAEMRRLIQSRLERGRVDVTVQITPAPGRTGLDVRVDAALARRYVEQARALATEIGVPGDVSLAWVLERPGVVRAEEAAAPDAAQARPLVAEALGRALDELVARRAAEGAALASELRALRAELATHVEIVGARAPQAAARRGERLRERMLAMLGEAGVDEARVLTEVAAWAQKTDITEEIARLRAHLDEVTLMIEKGGPVGRAFDFLIQELNREVNTVGSKADDLELSQAALAAKGVLEKMREQAQNLE